MLQIAAALGIVAFHVGIRHSHAGWIAVELFFVMAGMNMARSIERDASIGSYAIGRIRRLGPMILVVWGATVVFIAAGYGTSGMLWFVATAPVFAQNLTLALFHYIMPNDWVFGPLWFVGALLQLQLVLFLARRVLVKIRPAVLVALCVTGGVLFRLLLAKIVGDDAQTLSAFQGDVLYCLPFTHLEAIVLGLLVGRGALPQLGRFSPCLAVVVLALDASVGLEFPLRLNFAHVWGYSVLAFAAASLCSPNGWPAVAVDRLRAPGWLDALVFKLSSLTYGAYAFHGLIMSTGLSIALLAPFNYPQGFGLYFAVTVVQSFLIAWMFDFAFRGLEERRTSPLPSGSPAYAHPSGWTEDRSH